MLLFLLYLATAASEPVADQYKTAVEALYSGQFPEAEKALDDLRIHHPYSRFAALAELRLADVHRDRGQALQAIEAYRGFCKFHPGHAQGHYARLQVAEAYFSMLPHDWGVLPPRAEKDQDAARQAIAAYDAFLNQAPAEVAGSLALARQHRADSTRQLADHEIYVARFYFGRQHYAAAAGRAELVLQNFADLGLDDEALWLAGKSRAEMGEAAMARLHLHRLIERHPKSPRADGARQALAVLEPPSP
jgi:outer membrane protein assembly factor BamD